jgi:hypothetical protein
MGAGTRRQQAQGTCKCRGSNLSEREQA